MDMAVGAMAPAAKPVRKAASKPAAPRRAAVAKKSVRTATSKPVSQPAAKRAAVRARSR